MALIDCPECQGRVSSRAVACVHCGYPVREASGDDLDEETLAEVSPRLFGGNWFTHLVVIILCVALVGFVVYAVEYLKCRATRLIISNVRTVLRTGIFEKRTNEVRHSDVRNVVVTQGVMERMFGVGQIALSSAGQADVEIEVKGIPDPQKLAELIRHHR